MDEYEELVVDPRTASRGQNPGWAASAVILVGPAIFLLLALCVLGLACWSACANG
jgi:hypothetical protein